jgi:formate dehydrogenase iron-sulfur subunit
MRLNRRDFLKKTAVMAGTALIGSSSVAAGQGPEHVDERYGVLVDTTVCNGCRRCEWACNEWNKNSNLPINAFDDKSVFEKVRRTHARTFTVVNRFINPKDSTPIYVKKQCMHCNVPACKDACFVDAFKKTGTGAVVYNDSVCVGCRYCMIACPFDVPAYEYDDPITPRVTKCTFCFDRIIKDGQVPACVQICPTETLRFGRRQDLITLARERIKNNPQRYIDHVYGEHEVGGTSWLYLSSVPFDVIGFRSDIGKTPIPDRSKGFLFTTKVLEIAAAWPLVYGAFYMISKRREKSSVKETSQIGKEKHAKKS